MVMRIESSLRLENDSTPHGEGWWKWSVWVEGSPEDLAAIQSVTYRLHPTFPTPVVSVDTAATKFRFSSAGWGEFSVSADAHMKDGRTIRLERWLNLGDDRARTAEASRPCVFLSYSIADSAIVSALTDALAKQGVDVRTAEQSDEADGAPLPQIDKQLQEADAVIALVSDPPSRFVEQEALTAHKKGRFVLPIVLGGATVSGALSHLARFELPDGRNVEALAQQIAARVKDHATPEESSSYARDVQA